MKVPNFSVNELNFLLGSCRPEPGAIASGWFKLREEKGIRGQLKCAHDNNCRLRVYPAGPICRGNRQTVQGTAALTR